MLPELPIAEWEDTRATLHMWTQIVGKVRLELAPQVNHWWEVPFYLTSRGFTTSPIPYQSITFDVDFDFAAAKMNFFSPDHCPGKVTYWNPSAVAVIRSRRAGLWTA